MQSVVISGECAERVDAGPSSTLVHLPGSATDGQLSAVEMRLSGGWDGPPSHVHSRVDHLWYVLDGVVELTLGERPPQRCVAGTCVYVPSGTPHRFSTLASSGATMLQIDIGQSLDGYFRELATAFAPGARIDPEQVGEIMRRHDTSPVIPTP